MINNLYLIVVVLVRLLAVGVIVGAAYAFIGSLLVGLIVGGGAAGFTWIPLVVALVSGVVLWLLAKPIAGLVTSEL